MPSFTILRPRATEEHLGFIPLMLSDSDPRPAREQFDQNYAHGGGWRPMQGWSIRPHDGSLKYPGDPAMLPIARAQLHDETIFVYESAWVAIVQPDGSFEVARMD